MESVPAFVAALRATPGFDPTLSLVAEAAGIVVGHVLLSPVLVGEEPALVLSPLAVLPEWQRRGIGDALTRQVLDVARAAGTRVVVVLGHPTYYPRFGFEPMADHGIRQPFATGAASMVLFLDPTARGAVRGQISYPATFAPVLPK
jgi:putative acetyltransferase